MEAVKGARAPIRLVGVIRTGGRLLRPLGHRQYDGPHGTPSGSRPPQRDIDALRAPGEAPSSFCLLDGGREGLRGGRRGVGNQTADADVEKTVRGTRIVFGKLEGLLSWAALQFRWAGRVLTLHVELEQQARTLYRFF
jgi:hypothetical protein